VSEVFRCGHPRTAENAVSAYNNGRKACAFCRRVRAIVKKVERAQRRINAGGYTIGEKIASGRLHG
jgi:hypothetical protein